MLQRVDLAALAVVLGVSSVAYAQGTPNHRDLVVEGITEQGDIYGWETCPPDQGDDSCKAVFHVPFVFVVQCDGTYAYYTLDPVSLNGAKALGAVRDELGRLMVCGVSHWSDGPFGDLPIAWLLDGGEDILASQGDDFVTIDPNAGLSSGGSYVKGFFSDVVADEENDRWILVGAGRIGDALGPEGATTLVIPFETEVDPAAYARYGPVDEPDLDGLLTTCPTYSDPPLEYVEGSTSIAWGIQRSAGMDETFYTAGLSEVWNVYEQSSNITNGLGFRDLLGPEDLEMPVQTSFLVEPDDWLCVEELGEAGNNSVLWASAFDVLETGVVVGSLKTDSSNSNRSYGFWVNDEMVVNRFSARYNSENDSAALGAALRSEGWVHAVGMERIGEPGQVSPKSNVYRVEQSFLLLPSIFEDVDRALEWRFENGSPSVFDLNDRISETEHPGVVLLSASDVNGSGSITGLAYRDANTDDAGYFGYLLTTDDELTDLDQLRLDTPVGCYGDISGDGDIDGADLGLILGSWGATGDCLAADMDGNGVVNGADLGWVLGGWGGCP